MARSKLPSTQVFHDSGFRFRRLKKNPKRLFSVSVHIQNDDGEWIWSASRKLARLSTPDNKTELLELAEAYRFELNHPEIAKAQADREHAQQQSVAEYARTWYTSTQRSRFDRGKIRESSYERLSYSVKHIEQYFSDITLAQLTPHVIFAADAEMVAGSKSPKPLSEKTRHNTMLVLKRICRQARRDKLIDEDPFDIIETEDLPSDTGVSQETKDRLRITSAQADELNRFLLAQEPTGLTTAVWLARNTGMRRGEILGLSWSDIERTKQGYILKLRKQWTGKKTRLTDLKTKNSARDIPIDRATMDYLLTWKEKQKQEFAEGFWTKLDTGKTEKIPVEWNDSAPVCSNNAGRRWARGNFNRAVRLLFVEAGLGTFTDRRSTTKKQTLKDGTEKVYETSYKTGYVGPTLHSLRHTYASELVAVYKDPKAVQRLLGHANISITLNLYAEAQEENMREAVELNALRRHRRDDDNPQTPLEVELWEELLEERKRDDGLI